MRRYSRPGYGLFQLLVILAVLAMLLGLLLPAVHKVRLAAARAQSSNNLKQIGLALHTNHDANNKFPAGVDDKNYSTLFHLLPYIEAQNTYQAIDQTKECDDKANAKAAKTAIKVFLSPLDSLNEGTPSAGTNYFAMAGSKMPLKDNDGICYRGSATRIQGITDGTSNTLAFVEMMRGDGGKKAVSVERQHVRLKEADLKTLGEKSGVAEWKADTDIVGTRGAAWIDGRFLQATMTATRGMRDEKPDVDCGGEGGLSAVRMSPIGAMVLLCDGSVRTVSENISFATWQAAATAAGGEVLGNDW